jgi:hypothetical protein
MIMDKKREQTNVSEKKVSTGYLPQRDLPMPPYEFQTPNLSTGGLSTTTASAHDNKPFVERASLRNFSIR